MIISINLRNLRNASFITLNAYAAELNAHIEPYIRLSSGKGEDEQEETPII